MDALSKFGSAYRFAGVEHRDVSAQTMADATCAAMDQPSARTSEAAANALWILAQSGACVRFDASPDARRRLGFLAESLAHRDGAPLVLLEWADEFWDGDSESPLVLTSDVSDSRLARLQQEGNPLSKRWNVWGPVELREEYL